MPNPPNPPTQLRNEKYEEIELLRADDGLCVQITQNAEKGRVSWALCREYDRDGRTVRTSFMGRRHIESLEALLERLKQRLDHHEDRAREAVRERARSTGSR